MDTKDIKKLAEYSLSGSDIAKIVDNKANIMNYRDFQKYDNIDDALGKYGALVLLYESRLRYGHWTLVFRSKDGTIEHFDSFGYKPDQEQDNIDEIFKYEHYNDVPHLTKLLYESGEPIRYSQYRLQSKKKDINTCGRWVAMRLLLRCLNENQFKKLMTTPKGINPDYLVTVATQLILENII